MRSLPVEIMISTLIILIFASIIHASAQQLIRSMEDLHFQIVDLRNLPEYPATKSIKKIVLGGSIKASIEYSSPERNESWIFMFSNEPKTFKLTLSVPEAPSRWVMTVRRLVMEAEPYSPKPAYKVLAQNLTLTEGFSQSWSFQISTRPSLPMGRTKPAYIKVKFKDVNVKLGNATDEYSELQLVEVRGYVKVPDPPVTTSIKDLSTDGRKIRISLLVRNSWDTDLAEICVKTCWKRDLSDLFSCWWSWHKFKDVIIRAGGERALEISDNMPSLEEPKYLGIVTTYLTEYGEGFENWLVLKVWRKKAEVIETAMITTASQATLPQTSKSITAKSTRILPLPIPPATIFTSFGGTVALITGIFVIALIIVLAAKRRSGEIPEGAGLETTIPAAPTRTSRQVSLRPVIRRAVESPRQLCSRYLKRAGDYLKSAEEYLLKGDTRSALRFCYDASYLILRAKILIKQLRVEIPVELTSSMGLKLLRTAKIIDEEEYRFYDRLRRLRNYYEHQAKEEFPPRNKVEPILIELKRRFNEVKAMFKPERRRPREPSYIT